MKRAILMHPEQRARLNRLPEEVAHRIDDAVQDLAEGVSFGTELPDIGAFVFTTPRGDCIVYDVSGKNLIVLGFTTLEGE